MSSQTLKLKFGTASGEKTWSFKYANPDITTNAVKALMNTMITNGSIYKYPPLTAVSAQLEISTTTDIDVG